MGLMQLVLKTLYTMTIKRVNGKILNNLWDIGAKHALFREDGKWYHQLNDFPGVLFDANGYIVFESHEEYLDCPHLQIKKDLHVPRGISSIPGYVKITEEYIIHEFSQQIDEISQKNKNYSKPNKITTRRKTEMLSVPKAVDISQPKKAKRVLSKTNRIIRDTRIAKWVKYVHSFQCQICGNAIELQNGNLYSEAHHLKPLGEPHNGPDIVENIVCVCPNHHAQLDYGAIEINKPDLNIVHGHRIGDQYINYHNTVIVKIYSG